MTLFDEHRRVQAEGGARLRCLHPPRKCEVESLTEAERLNKAVKAGNQMPT